MKRYAIFILLALIPLLAGIAGYVYSKSALEQEQTTPAGTIATLDNPLAPHLDALKIEELVNQERAKLGRASLTHSEQLTQSACAKADHMIANDYWAHVAPDGTTPRYFIESARYNYTLAGENLGYGAQNDELLVNQWMNSPTHKENIVKGYTETGVCVRMNVSFQGKEYTNVIVQHFATP